MKVGDPKYITEINNGTQTGWKNYIHTDSKELDS